MRDRTIIGSALIVAAALVLPRLLPQHVATGGFVFRIDPTNGRACIVAYQGSPAVELAQDLEDQVCSSVRAQAVAELKAELARRAKEHSQVE